MAEDLPTDTYPSFRSSRERLALGLVLLVVLGLPLAALGYQRLQAAGPVRVIELTARLPTAQHGGWTPEIITVQQGERVRLRLNSADVVHGFSIPKLGINVDWVEPGKVAEVEFVADRPGRYTFQCTVWCQLGHWRMRGIIEVVDPDDPVASAKDLDPPQTNWVASGIDIDAAHPGKFVPDVPPNAGNGQRLWAEISARPLAELLAELDLQQQSPSDIYTYLSRGLDGEPSAAMTHQQGQQVHPFVAGLTALPEADLLAELTAGQRWDIVAALYYASTTPEALAAGGKLYEQDCTGCHGLDGQGDGPGAEALSQPGKQGEEHAGMNMDKAPTDFTDLSAQAGASSLLYYGKLVRGGMGTSMPYWGTIYNEDELWAMIAYLRGFAFDFQEPTVAR